MNEEAENIKSRIRLWLPHIEALAHDYAWMTHQDSTKLHPIHQDLIDDMRTVADEN